MNKKWVGLGIALAVVGGWWMAPEPEVEEEEPPAKSISKPDQNQRRVRQGPRKPPADRKQKSNTTPRKPNKPLPEIAKAIKQAAESNEMEKKVELYLEQLDALDDPNPSQLITLGELAFDANDAASAYDHYLEVIEQHTDDAIAPYALYKFAWVQFNLGDKSAAIDDMELVVEWIGEGENRLDEQLLKEVQTDLAYFRETEQ